MRFMLGLFALHSLFSWAAKTPQPEVRIAENSVTFEKAEDSDDEWHLLVDKKKLGMLEGLEARPQLSKIEERTTDKGTRLWILEVDLGSSGTRVLAQLTHWVLIQATPAGLLKWVCALPIRIERFRGESELFDLKRKLEWKKGQAQLFATAFEEWPEQTCTVLEEGS